jgi:hypothetical protein
MGRVGYRGGADSTVGGRRVETVVRNNISGLGNTACGTFAQGM